MAKIVNLNRTIDLLKKNGYWVAGLDKNGNNSISEIKTISKLVIIIGSENKGMNKLTSENCDFTISIPINKKVDSLNASIAASIVLHQLS